MQDGNQGEGRGRRSVMTTRKLRPTLAVSGVLIALAAGGCADSSPSAGAGSDGDSSFGDLDGLTFFSTQVTRADQPQPLVDGTHISLQFSDRGIAANAGCNSMSGDATLSDSVLVVKGVGLAMTEMGCDPALMDQDSWIAGILTAEPTLIHKGDRLTLTSGDTVIDFLDKQKVEPDQPLVGTAWRLDSIGTTGSDGADSSIPGGVVSTLKIDGGRAAIEPGCNHGSAKVDIADATITFGPAVLTRMACQGAAGDVETAVLAVIDGEVGYTIDGNVLTLTKDSQTLTYRLSDKINPAD
jgi:heat shock protein HslJ